MRISDDEDMKTEAAFRFLCQTFFHDNCNIHSYESAVKKRSNLKKTFHAPSFFYS